MTGSARGIGAEVARGLAADGWSVALHYRAEKDAALALRDELGERCAGVYQADLEDPAAARALWAAFVADGPADALVNNAGIYSPHGFLDQTPEGLDALARRMFEINFFSPMRLAHEAGEAFRAQQHGKVLNVASRVGFRGEPGAALYAASKAALINLTRSLAVEWSKFGIQVFGMAPGWVNTAMAREGMTEREETILRDIPLGRMATPHDCANVAKFLLSDDSNYLSGITIDINGATYFH